MRYTKRKFTLKLYSFILLLIVLWSCQESKEPSEQKEVKSYTNFVVIFADDLGYGDLGCYGHPTIKTPNLDQMASEGQRWTNFYVAANVCTPSRGALLTGRYPVRIGLATNKRGVFFPDSDGGLPTNEVTIAKLLKSKDYATACVGKWHLGHLPEYLPTNHGFDYFFGLPYSNDMDRTVDMSHYEACQDPKSEYFNVPLMRNEEIIERPANQNTITKRYTEEAVSFIKQNKEKPFFLYLAHSMPHVPLFASKDFEGKSERGLFGDVVEEVDWSVGQVLKTLKEQGLDENTLVVFTSDNGPWVVMDQHGGSAGLLYGAKATSYEGGVREPAIFRMPGTVEPGVISKMGSTLDLLPTISKMAGIPLPDKTYDGYDLMPVLKGGEQNPRQELIYYHGYRVFAARKGDYKLLYYSNNPRGYPGNIQPLEKPQLFNVMEDPGERFDLAEQFPEKIDEITAMVEEHKATVIPVESQLEKRIQN